MDKENEEIIVKVARQHIQYMYRSEVEAQVIMEEMGLFDSRTETKSRISN